MTINITTDYSVLLPKVALKYRAIIVQIDEIGEEVYKRQRNNDNEASANCIIEFGTEETNTNTPAQLKFNEVKTLSENDTYLQMCCLFEIGADSLILDAKQDGYKGELFSWEQLI